MKEGNDSFQEYGLIGKKLSHSFSQKYFNQKFKSENINSKYHLFELQNIQKFPKLIKTHPKLRGLNVTVPYKETVIKYLDKLSKTAQIVRAVNTIVIEDDGTLTGHNTDVFGFLYSLEKKMPDQYISSVLILGTGGAAKAVTCAIQIRAAKRVRYVSREEKGSPLSHINYAQLNALPNLDEFDLIVNATPVGTYPDSDKFPDFPYHLLNEKHIVFDLVYNPSKTLFLQKSEAAGSQIINGLDMLHAQAERAWEIWQMCGCADE